MQFWDGHVYRKTQIILGQEGPNEMKHDRHSDALCILNTLTYTEYYHSLIFTEFSVGRLKKVCFRFRSVEMQS